MSDAIPTSSDPESDRPAMDEAGPVAVLVSGGLDSAVLVSEAAGRYSQVHPLYVRSGLYWEPAELTHLRRFLDRQAGPTLAPLVTLDLPVADLYGNHWAISGRDVPGAASPDEAVYLPGRNVLLLGKALLWCHLRDVPTLALGLLEANPFPDATAAFFRLYTQAVNEAVGGRVRVVCPFAGLSKVAVVRRGRDLPLHLTWSCLLPEGGRPCGRCNKCAERRRAFAAAGLPDPTPYPPESPCTA